MATLILVGAFGLFELELAAGADVAQARTVAVNLVVVVEIFYLLASGTVQSGGDVGDSHR